MSRDITVWQVQDSNLRRHTPTDLQSADAQAVTCRFTTSWLNLGTNSPQRRRLLFHGTRYKVLAEHGGDSPGPASVIAPRMGDCVLGAPEGDR